MEAGVAFQVEVAEVVEAEASAGSVAGALAVVEPAAAGKPVGNGRDHSLQV